MGDGGDREGSGLVRMRVVGVIGIIPPKIVAFWRKAYLRG